MVWLRHQVVHASFEFPLFGLELVSQPVIVSWSPHTHSSPFQSSLEQPTPSILTLSLWISISNASLSISEKRERKAVSPPYPMKAFERFAWAEVEVPKTFENVIAKCNCSPVSGPPFFTGFVRQRDFFWSLKGCSFSGRLEEREKTKFTSFGTFMLQVRLVKQPWFSISPPFPIPFHQVR